MLKGCTSSLHPSSSAQPLSETPRLHGGFILPAASAFLHMHLPAHEKVPVEKHRCSRQNEPPSSRRVTSTAALAAASQLPTAMALRRLRSIGLRHHLKGALVLHIDRAERTPLRRKNRTETFMDHKGCGSVFRSFKGFGGTFLVCASYTGINSL